MLALALGFGGCLSQLCVALMSFLCVLQVADVCHDGAWWPDLGRSWRARSTDGQVCMGPWRWAGIWSVSRLRVGILVLVGDLFVQDCSANGDSCPARDSLPHEGAPRQISVPRDCAILGSDGFGLTQILGSVVETKWGSWLGSAQDHLQLFFCPAVFVAMCRDTKLAGLVQAGQAGIVGLEGLAQSLSVNLARFFPQGLLQMQVEAGSKGSSHGLAPWRGVPLSRLLSWPWDLEIWGRDLA